MSLLVLIYLIKITQKSLKYIYRAKRTLFLLLFEEVV